jgi:hypothetical protein
MAVFCHGRGVRRDPRADPVAVVVVVVVTRLVPWAVRRDDAAGAVVDVDAVDDHRCGRSDRPR